MGSVEAGLSDSWSTADSTTRSNTWQFTSMTHASLFTHDLSPPPLVSTFYAYFNTPTSDGDSGGHGLPTAVIASLSAVLGAAVVAIIALVCWKRRRRGRSQRVSLASGETWPADQTRSMVSHAAETVTTSVRARIGSISDNSGYAAVGLGGSVGRKEGHQDDIAGGGTSRAASDTASNGDEGEDEDEDRGSSRPSSLRERLREFFAGMRIEGGSVSSGEGPPPAYEPHVLPEYDASP